MQHQTPPPKWSELFRKPRSWIEYLGASLCHDMFEDAFRRYSEVVEQLSQDRAHAVELRSSLEAARQRNQLLQASARRTTNVGNPPTVISRDAAKLMEAKYKALHQQVQHVKALARTDRDSSAYSDAFHLIREIPALKHIVAEQLHGAPADEEVRQLLNRVKWLRDAATLEPADIQLFDEGSGRPKQKRVQEYDQARADADEAQTDLIPQYGTPEYEQYMSTERYDD